MISLVEAAQRSRQQEELAEAFRKKRRSNPRRTAAEMEPVYAKIRELRARGLTYVQIATDANVSSSVVHRLLGSEGRR